LSDFSETAIVEDLDALPFPDYSDYFMEISHCNLPQKVELVLSMESSRGCPKSQNDPCYFCGLNGSRCKYRIKSPDRVNSELEYLNQMYGINSFIMSDTILNVGYLKNLLRNLARQEQKYKMYFEITSNMTRDQMRLLNDAGVTWVQPGIESLHDDLLKLLNKGNAAINNIALLKYAREFGLRASWNLLYDIPGDGDSLNTQHLKWYQT